MLTVISIALALFLPALACCRSWSAEIALALPRGGPARLIRGQLLSLAFCAYLLPQAIPL